MVKFISVMLLGVCVCLCVYSINIVITEHNIILKVGRLVDELLKERDIK